MALPKNTETERLIYLRSIVDGAIDGEWTDWPMLTEKDCTLFGKIIVLFSYIDVSIRRIVEAREMLSTCCERSGVAFEGRATRVLTCRATETTPLGAVGPKRGRRRGRQPENQKLPAEVAKAGRMLSPERMRIVLDSLTEVPILNHAATKAGIHRKTLEYWLRRSAAGDAGYDIEWQGIEWRFHEHCTSAIDEADDSLRAVMWQIAMGVVSKTDENGNFIVEACGQPNMKMARHFLEWQRPEKWGKRRKRHVPHNAGVLVIGGDVTKKPEYDTTASVKARKWKSFSRKFREAKT
jgi:hypothetical protein